MESDTICINAGLEVIISSGTVLSPQLLMVSGIVPKKVLQEYNIPLVADLPSVGENFQNLNNLEMQFSSSLSMHSVNETTYKDYFEYFK